MGLDSVEFIMAIEESFHITISDEAAGRMRTAGDVVNHVLACMGSVEGPPCRAQRAFYTLRRASMEVLAQPRSTIRPATPWNEILGSRRRPHVWHLLHHAAGTPVWPRLTVSGRVPDPVTTVGETARYLAIHAAAALQRPGEGWSRRDVEDTVRGLMRDELGISDFRWDQEFARDLGVD